MAYDNSSLTGDEICDYHYDIENNFMNPPSPTGFFIYKVIGGAFDWLNDLVTQFRIDYSILDCNVGNVEIVKSFPEEPDTTHTYYVAQYATAEERVFTKYSYVDEWVTETVTGDVLNSLDTFWGRSYNLLRPLLYEGVYREYLFDDEGTTASHNDNWNGLQYMTRTDTGTIINNTSEATLFDAVYLNGSALPFTNEDIIVEFEIVENNVSTNTFRFDGQTLCDGETYRQYDFTFAQGETGRFKFVYDKANNTITKYKNGEYVSTHNHHFCGNVGFLFRIATGTSLKYKDFKVYKGEENERPLTDEEYRIYLYLKNHQLLTMKDLLVAFTNAFGSAETSTTILNSIHTVDHKRYDNPPFSNDSLKAYDDEDTDITTDKLVDKEGVNLINNRLAQGTTSILIPDDGWDEQFLRFLESFISIKGNILISVGG